jgi:phosphoribosyl-ATP pyrophosphohydrolase
MKIEIIEELINTIRDRKINPIEDSYTCGLLSQGDNKIIKKLGEELVEFVRAYLVEDDNRIVEECSDMLYHLLVALEFKNVPFEKVLEELEKRHHK